MLHLIRANLARTIDGKLVDELLQAYIEAKRNYYVGGLRLSEVEGGRFCEAAFRILEQRTTGKYLPLGRQLDTERLSRTLANLPALTQPESVRLHIPRALRVVYDIRNNRDAAHLADGIDPNVQDATLVVSILDWVLAELVRLHHGISASEAQGIVESLVTRRAPAIQDFDGFLKVLNPSLPASDHVLLLLYERGKEGATIGELEQWARPLMRANLRRTLGHLVEKRAFVHSDGSRHYITATGMREVERKKLYEMPD